MSCSSRDLLRMEPDDARVTNPWLAISDGDYVGHMSSPEVGQYDALNRIFRDVLVAVRPHSVLLLGCSSGNGLEHVDPCTTTSVVGIDINPSYLRRCAACFPAPAFQLDLR